MTRGAVLAAVAPDEPRAAGQDQCRGHEEVQAQPEDVVGGVDAQQLLKMRKPE